MNTNAVVVDTSQSPHARLKPVPVNAVTLDDAFWAPRLKINREVTLPSQYQQCEETGRLDNFRRVSGKKDVPFVGIYFNDSDVYKWLEAASWSLATHPDDPALQKMVDDTITEVADAQDANGYLNTYFSVERVGERWTNLKDMHELYCAGHLFQAAVAHVRATGGDTLLTVALRFADHICDTFGPQDTGRREGTCGHEEIEMGLVELYRVTGHQRYLDQADYFISARGQNPSACYNDRDPASAGHDRHYRQDHVPFRQLEEVTGHAVRQIYLDCGATDVLTETGDQTLKTALDAQWDNMTGRRMYVTGALGARHEGEAFGKDYELPSDRAYAETCASIANVMWNWRLLQLTGEARYADLMELALYNGVLAGLSLDGTQYFYVNPLADDGAHRRQPWFGCACCPPNVARLLASLSGYFYSTSDEAVWVHLYASGRANIVLPDGGNVRLKTETNYPWDGDVTLTLTEAPEYFSALHLRVPAWVDGAAVTVNDVVADVETRPGEYAVVYGDWKPGDKIRLLLPMPPRQVVGHPYVADTFGKVALMRGPLVYCFEQADYRDPEEAADIDVRDIIIPSDAGISALRKPDLLGGLIILAFVGLGADNAPWGKRLYQDAEVGAAQTDGTYSMTAIPYYAWANREPGAMRVWLLRA